MAINMPLNCIQSYIYYNYQTSKMRRKDLTISEKNGVVQFLLEGSNNGRMSMGRRKLAVTKFNSSKRTISRIWAEARKQKERGETISMQNGKTNKRRKRVIINLELIASLEYHKRITIEQLAASINCKPTTVARWIRTGLIRSHTSSIRPDLTVPNKLLRLQFSLEALEVDSIMNTLKFKSMHNTIHIDEKWFYITRGMQRYYLTPEEIDPHRTCQSKKFITKVMFMCAVARPIFATDGGVLFDGKIGMFPFTVQEPTKRSSKNRPAGTMETKAIDSVTKQVILPAIKAKWPTEGSKHVFIQQDNARPHIKDNDLLFREAAIDGELTFTLVQQPPNSPDTNVNDLGWFRAIQSLQTRTPCKTVDQLVHAVMKSFEELTATKLNNVFLSLQGCMVEIMKVRGTNNYKSPHMRKRALIRAGTLPLNLEVDPELVRQCLIYLNGVGLSAKVQVIKNALGIELPLEEEE